MIPKLIDIFKEIKVNQPKMSKIEVLEALKNRPWLFQTLTSTPSLEALLMDYEGNIEWAAQDFGFEEDERFETIVKYYYIYFKHGDYKFYVITYNDDWEKIDISNLNKMDIQYLGDRQTGVFLYK